MFILSKSVTFKPARFNNDRVITQHTPKCVENYSEDQLSYVHLIITSFTVTLIKTLKTGCVLVMRTNSLVHEA